MYNTSSTLTLTGNVMLTVTSSCRTLELLHLRQLFGLSNLANSYTTSRALRFYVYLKVSRYQWATVCQKSPTSLIRWNSETLACFLSSSCWRYVILSSKGNTKEAFFPDNNLFQSTKCTKSECLIKGKRTLRIYLNQYRIA